MNIGDLFDILQEKLKTGEFTRLDDLDVAGYDFSSIEKVNGGTVRIYIDEDLPDCSNCFEESDNEELAKLTEQLDGIRDLMDDAEEINMSNYDVNQVSDLNNFYIQVSQLLEGKKDGGAQ